MKVLDLFSGTGGWSQAFLDRGHLVTRIDNDPRFRDVTHTQVTDVLSMLPIQDDVGRYDVILASPPCQAFSLASVRHHMDASVVCQRCGDRVMRLRGEKWDECCGKFQADKETLYIFPSSDFAKMSERLVRRTLGLIDVFQPRYWWLENPRGTMKHFIPTTIPKTTVWYCRYGDTSAKPTNLWGRWPGTWTPRAECHNGNPDHQQARRGSKTGTQGKKGAVERGKIPYRLSEEVCLAAEQMESNTNER